MSLFRVAGFVLALSLPGFLCSCGSADSGGLALGTESHGSGGLLDRFNPWFLVAKDAPRDVEYCIEVDRTSVYEADEYAELVEDALAQWKVFFERYNAKDAVLGVDIDHFKLRFSDRKERQLAMKFKKVDRCTKPAEQLRFLFGPKPPSGESVDGRWSTALGAAVRGPYNHETFWNGGTVWVHNRYREGRRVIPRAKLHILLHELGHVFGMRHNETWAMYEFAADESNEPTVPGLYPKELGRIELPTWRFRLLPKDEMAFSRMEFSASRAGFTVPAAKERENELFEALGAKGDTVVENLRFEGCDKDGTKQFTLELSELRGNKITELKGEFLPNRVKNSLELEHGPGIFTRWILDDEIVPMNAAFWNEPDVVPAQGFFTTKDGKKTFEARLSFRYGTTLYLSMPDKKSWMRWSSKEIHRLHGARNDWDF